MNVETRDDSGGRICCYEVGVFLFLSVREADRNRRISTTLSTQWQRRPLLLGMESFAQLEGNGANFDDNDNMFTLGEVAEATKLIFSGRSVRFGGRASINCSKTVSPTSSPLRSLRAGRWASINWKPSSRGRQRNNHADMFDYMLRSARVFRAQEQRTVRRRCVRRYCQREASRRKASLTRMG